MSTKKIGIAIILLIAAIPAVVKAQTFIYEIRGEIKGLKNDTMIFMVMTGEKPLEIKVAAINDKFHYTGTTNGNYMVTGQIAGKRNAGDFNFFLDKGVLMVSGNTGSVEDVKVTGTPINDEYAAGTKQELEFYKKRDSIYKISKVEKKDGPEYNRLMTNIDSLMELLQVFRINYVEQHPASLFGATQLYVMQDKITPQQLEKLYNSVFIMLCLLVK